jgi:2-methylcitrate dehydratase PrpD
LQEFERDTVLDSTIRNLCERITVVNDGNEERFGKQEVIVHLRGGRMLSRAVLVMKGHPDNPMSARECVEKARACLRHAQIQESIADRIERWTSQLEQSGDAIPALIDIIAQPQACTPA